MALPKLDHAVCEAIRSGDVAAIRACIARLENLAALFEAEQRAAGTGA